MKRLRVLWVGKTDKGFPQAGMDYYLKRIRPLEPIDCIEGKSAHHSGRNQQHGVRTESEAILKRLSRSETVALLDQSGKLWSSEYFAQWLQQVIVNSVTFVIGGAFGVDRAVNARADVTISLSSLTMPHQLARIVLLEQIYRGLTLRAGHGYHHV